MGMTPIIPIDFVDIRRSHSYVSLHKLSFPRNSISFSYAPITLCNSNSYLASPPSRSVQLSSIRTDLLVHMRQSPHDVPDRSAVEYDAQSSILFMGVILLLDTGRILVGEEASVAGTLACMESTSTYQGTYASARSRIVGSSC